MAESSIQGIVCPICLTDEVRCSCQRRGSSERRPTTIPPTDLHAPTPHWPTTGGPRGLHGPSDRADQPPTAPTSNAANATGNEVDMICQVCLAESRCICQRQPLQDAAANPIQQLTTIPSNNRAAPYTQPRVQSMQHQLPTTDDVADEERIQDRLRNLEIAGPAKYNEVELLSTLLEQEILANFDRHARSRHRSMQKRFSPTGSRLRKG